LGAKRRVDDHEEGSFGEGGGAHGEEFGTHGVRKYICVDRWEKKTERVEQRELCKENMVIVQILSLLKTVSFPMIL
jgi:hypothetical protein